MSRLNYDYTLPNGWTEVRTDNSLVLYDPSRRLSVTITEQIVEPWKFPTALALGAQLLPDEPTDWDEWNLGFQQPIGSGDSYKFEYDGKKFGHDYLNFIRWYLWGDSHVQVSAELSQEAWDSSPSLGTELNTLIGSFSPHDGTRVFTEEDVMTMLSLRLDERRSGIFARDEVLRARYELTCSQIFTDLISGAENFGGGVWQMSAQALEGQEAWRVYAPSGSIVAIDSNKSRC